MSIRTKCIVGVCIAVVFPLILSVDQDYLVYLTIVTGMMLVNAWFKNSVEDLNFRYFIGLSIFGCLYLAVREYIDQGMVDWKKLPAVLIGGAIGYVLIQFYFKEEIKENANSILNEAESSQE